MVNNNKILIENKKQIEEIHEIKNEIPTYEEFLKTYNANEIIVNSYENEIKVCQSINLIF